MGFTPVSQRTEHRSHLRVLSVVRNLQMPKVVPWKRSLGKRGETDGM